MQKRFLQLDNIFLPVSAAFGLVCLTWIIHKEKYTFLCACGRQDSHKNPPKPKHKSCQIQVVKEPSQRQGKGYSICSAQCMCPVPICQSLYSQQLPLIPCFSISARFTGNLNFSQYHFCIFLEFYFTFCFWKSSKYLASKL